MKKLTLTIIAVTTLLLASCSYLNRDDSMPTDVFERVYNVANVVSQVYALDNTIDNIIEGRFGTKIRINKNSFVDAAGNIYKGLVDVELKEAFTQGDWVNGNLVTVFNGAALQTGGMIYLNAKSNDGGQLKVAPGSSIPVSVPADTVLEGMSLFQGREDSIGIHWEDPVPIAQPEPGAKDVVNVLTFEKTINVNYWVEGYETDTNAIPQEIQLEVGKIAWAGDGVKISKRDSAFKIGETVVHFVKFDSLRTWAQTFSSADDSIAGVDYRTRYIFALANLGWANIDRLLLDPRSKEIQLAINVDDADDFALVYVTLLTSNMYLPAYSIEDETYGFSPGSDKVMLPVGETAKILATAYKNDVPYFAVQEIIIGEKKDISLELEKTTTEELQSRIASISDPAPSVGQRVTGFLKNVLDAAATSSSSSSSSSRRYDDDDDDD